MVTAAKIESAVRELTTQARKVYDLVPITHTMSLKDIIAEAHRQKLNIPPNVIEGCVNSLRGDGLVREPMAGQFVRTRASNPSVLAPVAASGAARRDYDAGRLGDPPASPALVAAPDVAPKSPIDRIGELAARMRVLAADLEQAALDCQAEIERCGDDSAKLRQLQALLKGV